MKKDIYLICTMLAALCVNCASPGIRDFTPYGCHLQPLASWSVLYSNFDKNSMIHLDFKRSYQSDLQWSGSNSIMELQNHMNNQLKEYLNNPNFEEINGYLYGKLINVEITSDCAIDHRAAGENLTDLFEFHIIYPLFLYPDGEMVEYSNWEHPISKTISEFVNKEYLFPYDISLVCNVPEIENYESVCFTIIVTLSDGTSEKTLTSECTLDL